jgi:WD40 repeat protein
MPSVLRRVPAFALLVALVLGLALGGADSRALAQPEPKKEESKKEEPAKKTEKDRAESKPPSKAPELTAEDVKALAEKFQAERAAALKAKFPEEALTRADELARRGAAALDLGNIRAAARFYRDARWQVPFLPVNLPPHVVRVFGESRMRHPQRVNDLSYSPDGTRIASASLDGTVKIWDLGNGRELVTYRGHADVLHTATEDVNVLRVGGVAFQPRGKMVASVGGTEIHLWDPENGKQIKILAKLEKTDRPLKCLDFSPDGKSLAVGGDDGILRVYDVASGKETFKSPSRNFRIERVAYSPNGKLIAVGDTNGNAAVYAPGASNTMPMSTQVIDGECYGVAFSADRGAIFTGGRDGKARLTAGPNPDGSSAGNTATLLSTFTGHTGSVNDLAVTPDGKALITGGDDRTVRVWDVGSGKQLRSYQGHMMKVLAVAVRPDGRQIASASEDGAIRLWDMSSEDDHKALTEATEPIWAVAVSPDGKHIAAAGADKMVRIYEAETGKLEAELAGHTSAVTTLAFFPDSKRLVSAGGDRVLRIWDITAKKPIQEIAGHELPVLSVAVDPDGKVLVSGAADRSVRGWDPDSGKQLWSWTGKSAVCSVAIRPGAKTMAVGTADGTLHVLDISGGSPKEMMTTSAHVAGVAGIAYSPDGSKLATAGGDGATRIWTIDDDGQPTALARFEGQPKTGSSSGFSPLSGIAFSPDNRFVATVGADTVVRIWDVQTKAEVRGLRGHTEWATAVAFGPDSRLLVSGGADKAVRVFELTPQEGGATAGHLLPTNAVAIDPTGKIAATASVDETIKLWDLATGKEIATLIGNSDTPYTVTFLGPKTVVMGGTLPTRDTGWLHVWQTDPPRVNNTIATGEVYLAVGLADGSKIAAWSARPVVGGTNKNSMYEVFDRDGKPLASLADKGREVRAATFSADLTWVIAGDETGTLRIWDLAKQERIGADWPIFANPIGDVGITPDKKYLAALDQNGNLKVADVEKREVLGSAVAHKAGIRGLLVSPKGDTLLTIGADREVKLWSLADPKALKELRSWKMPVGVNGAAFAPDGSLVVTANADGTAYVLELP